MASGLLCVTASLIVVWSPCLALTSIRKSYTYFASKPKTWNSAFEFCQLNGMRLVTPISENDNDAIRRFALIPDWENKLASGPQRNGHIWTGLHSPTGVAQELVDGSCISITPINGTWLDVKSIERSKCFRAEVIKERQLKAEACDRNHDVICEKDIGRCVFERRRNMTMDMYSYDAIHYENLTDCSDACLHEDLNNGVECRAFTSYPFTKNCILFAPPSFSLIESLTTPASAVDLHIKMCYDAVFDKDTVIPVSTENKNTEPASNCTWLKTDLQRSSSALPTSTGTTSVTTEEHTSDVTSTTDRNSVVTTTITSTTESYSMVTTTTPTTESNSVVTTTITPTTESNSVVTTTITPTTASNSVVTTTITPTTESNSVVTTTITPTTDSKAVVTTTVTIPLSVSNETTPATVKAISSSLKYETTSLSFSPTSTGLLATTETVIEEPCDCNCQSPNITQAEKDAFIEQLLGGIEVNKTEISSTRRKYTSAVDERVTSTSIGFVGGALICLPVIIVVVLDISTMKAHFSGN